MNLREIEPPLGKFVIENASGIQLADGTYYYYTEVLKVLSLYKKKIQDQMNNKYALVIKDGKPYIGNII